MVKFESWLRYAKRMTFSSSADSIWKRPRAVLTTYGLFGLIGLFIAIGAVLVIPSDSKSALLFGLSVSRLALTTFGLILVLFLAWFSVQSWRDPFWAERCWKVFTANNKASAAFRILSTLVFAASWLLTFVPAYRFEHFESYFVRLYPFLIWFLVFSGLTVLVSWFGRNSFDVAAARGAIQSRTVALIIMLAVILFSLAYQGLGARLTSTPGDEYIYGAGVPVLGIQILLAFVLGLLTLQAEWTNLLSRFKHPDLWIALVIFVLTVALWIREPAPPSYFNPGPYPPNNEYYPFSDASIYDLGSQYTLIGQKLFSGNFFERPLYMQFLVFLHMLAGQNYTNITNLQTVILALFTVFLYLLGKEMSGHPLGVGLGVLGMLRGMNTIAAASMIDLGSPKQLLTDFPTAVGIALLVYLTVKWLKCPDANRYFVFWAGGLIGLLSLVRTNVLLLFIPIGILVLIVYRHKLSLAIALGVSLIAIFLASILPWGLPSNTFLLETYYIKIRNVILLRYHSEIPSSPTVSLPLTTTSAKDLPISVSLSNSNLRASTIQTTTSPRAEALASLGFVPKHFLHNLLTSFLSLPASPYFYSLRDTVKVIFPYWQQNWDGSVSTGAAFLLLQLILLAFGLGMAWKRLGLAGLAPLFIFLTYQLANALGRTSGGRYIIPVDWIVFIYYLFGVFEIVFLILEIFQRKILVSESAALPSDEFKWDSHFTMKTLGIFALFIVIGLSPTITDSMFPLRYSPAQAKNALAQLDKTGDLQKIDTTLAAVDHFIQQPNSIMIYGRALYPRFYPANKGESDSGYPYKMFPFPRLALTVIGPRLTDNVVFPLDKSPYFPNAADVLILGCSVSNPDTLHLAHVDALAIFVIEPNKTSVYTRQPAALLQCPAPPVVCDNNKECRSGN